MDLPRRGGFRNAVRMSCAVLLVGGIVPMLASVGKRTASNHDKNAVVGAEVAAAIPENREAAEGSAPADAVAKAAPSMEMMTVEARKKLAEIGYWTDATERQGSQKPDQRLRIALEAFQRAEGRKPTGVLSFEELKALRAAARPVPRETGYAHIEADITRQILFVVAADGSVTKVLPISSGSGKAYSIDGKRERAVTPRGRFVVYNKISGWRQAPLGGIYYPCYFNRGVAIHGSPSVPSYPASHGCIRIPIAAAKELADVAPIGTVVLVYDGDRSSEPALEASR